MITLTCDALAVGLVSGLYATVAPLVPDEAQLERYRPAEATNIYSRDGQLLASIFEENRKVVPISQIPKNLKLATIAIEDERFEEHPGVDPRGVARALRENVGGGHMQGGSTITQQLARDIYLSRERKISRKLQEMTLALRIERRFSKEEILGLYMNQICYGHRAYGVNAAAQTLFGKSLDQLTLAECALIAGLARNPEGYSPINHPSRAEQRRNVVLAKMRELHYIEQKEFEQASKEPIKTRAPEEAPWKLKHYRAPWFTTYVIQQLVKQYGEDKVYRGGLQVYTTVDLSLQEKAQRVLDQGLEEHKYERANRGAVVCLDPRNGEVLAMVGGRDFAKDEFNSAWQAKRQPGSSFKPIMYTTAMERIGLTPDDYYDATPSTFEGYWGTYRPQNYSASQVGSMSVAHALAISCNVVAVRVIIRTGPKYVIEQAHRMGIDPEGKFLQPYPALALGAGEVSPLEMATAYTSFANGGFRADPSYITHITDSAGNLIYQAQPRLERVMSPRTAVWMNQMLQGVVSGGTGKEAQIDAPVGGKTGTTNSAKDVWFIGFTPGFCGVVWLGNDANQRMYSASGGFFCAPLWKQLALAARDRAKELGTPWPDHFPDPGNEAPKYQGVADGGSTTKKATKEGPKAKPTTAPAERKPEVAEPAMPEGDLAGADRPDVGGEPVAPDLVDTPRPDHGEREPDTPRPHLNPDRPSHAEPEPEPAPHPKPKPKPKPKPAPDGGPKPAPEPAPTPDDN